MVKLIDLVAKWAQDPLAELTWYLAMLGPALCVYNDAVFSENDWEGIQMIYSSIKEEDPMKVGRFGLGFKSVFHITDFPCVISGDRVLLINPQQAEKVKVNATLDLCALEEYEEDGLDAEAFWVALEDTFGLCRQSLPEDGFQGTIFWFPLRENPSNLSETLYNESKVKNLFDSFALDASNILLFLKNIEKISLHTRDEERKISETLQLEIEDKDGAVRRSRQALKDQIQNQNISSECPDIHSTIHLSIHMLYGDKEERQEWLVVNYFVKESASAGFQKLIQDKNLGYSPYVGVATPLKEIDDDFEGHVFCFLPLPKEGERLTGLPVHVNGFFALSQNRHHMKWETEEQEGKPIDDKSILWNKALIEEALPKAYELLVSEIIEVSKKNSNDEISIKAVYNTLPTCKSSPRKTHKRWMQLENKLYEYLGNREILYAMHTREWINLRRAFFATFRTLSRSEGDVVLLESVVRCFQKIGVQYVDIPFSLFDTLQAHFPYIIDLTQESLALQLKQQQKYKELTHKDKNNILIYLVRNKENFAILQDLELLPLASDKWIEFRKGSQPVFLCSDADVKMFPGQENRMVKESAKLGAQLTEFIEKICNSGSYQVQRLDVKLAKRLMMQTLNFHFGSGENVRWTKTSSLPSQWIENVWHVLINKKMVKCFKDIPIVPMLTQGSWIDPDVIELVRLSDFIIIKEYEPTRECILNDGLENCLKVLNVKVLPSLPEWIKFESIKEFVKRPTTEDIIYLFCEVYKMMGENAVSTLNAAFESNFQLRESLLQFAFALAYIEPDMVKMFQNLRMFKGVHSIGNNGKFSAIADVRRFISGDINFPSGIDFPFKCLKVDSQEESLITRLDAEKVSLETLVSHAIRGLRVSKKDVQILDFMNYFIEHFHLFENNKAICDAASQLPYLRVGTKLCLPSDLYDPSDSSLQRLLIGESLFPEPLTEFCETEIQALKRLGLKGIDKLTGDVMLKVANTLGIWEREKRISEDMSKKAKEFVSVLEKLPNLLNHKCSSGSYLGNALMSVQCMPVMRTPPTDYPNGMPWFSESIDLCKPEDAKHVEWSLLAGGTTPMVNCSSDTVINWFRWKKAPSIDKVIQQLSLISQNYNQKHKPDYSRAIQKIYQYLHEVDGKGSDVKCFLDREIVIWTGEGFVQPQNVIIKKRKCDLDIRPYYYFLPEELQEMDELFLKLNCNKEQDTVIFINALQSIKQKYESHDSNSNSLSSKDLDTSIVLEIFKVLAEKKTEGLLHIDESELLMLVEDHSLEKLSLQTVSLCLFEDDFDELDEEEERKFYIVNKEVPISIAKQLGVKSVKKKTILNATKGFSFKESGQHESLTTRISTLLRDSYKDGFSVPKEVIQNADDAGATVVRFLYDERVNHDARRVDKLFTSELQECQGPALWVYNNSVFTDKDLVNIRKLNGATKADNLDKIGKFGLGFCSVYNLTDVPSFISGNDMIIFDPHESYIKEALRKSDTGLGVELTERNLIRRNVDQFKPYHKVFGCDVLEKSFTKFDGTLFRLPLRTDYQAANSEICKSVYTKGEVSTLLGQFVENAGNVLLFSQNIKTVQIFHLSEKESDPSKAKLIFSVEKLSETKYQQLQTRQSKSILNRIPTIMKNREEFSELEHVIITQHFYKNSFISYSDEQLHKSFETKWLISWALGKNESLILSRKTSEKAAVPLSAVAVPVENSAKYPLMLNDVTTGFYKEGHLFCFLPLPIKTGLPVHLNGCFSVTSDRRALLSFTEDDKRKGDSYVWNKALMEDAMVLSYIELLKSLCTDCSDKYIYHSLWPLEGSRDVVSLEQSFFKKLIADETKLFKGDGKWLCLGEVLFLDPTVRCTEIGTIALEFLSFVPPRSHKTVIELPPIVLKGFIDCDLRNTIEQIIISEEELIMHFLNTLSISFWENQFDKRNAMILFALRTKSKAVIQKMKETKCIPSEPSNNLCRPNELINTSSDIAEMFDIPEGYFPWKADGFCDKTVIDQLINLGMNDNVIPNEMLFERCRSLRKLLKICGSCARDRCLRILKYCGKYHVLKKLEKDESSVEKLKCMLLIPVLPTPKDWKFSWRADELQMHNSNKECNRHSSSIKGIIRFDCPGSLFKESLYICCGSVCSFIHEQFLSEKNLLSEHLLQILGVKSEVSIQLLISQLKMLSNQYTDPQQQCNNLEIICRKIYENLARLIEGKSEAEISKISDFSNLTETPLIHIGNELVMPSKVAFAVKAECRPELYCLRDTNHDRRKVFKALGVVEYFSVNFLIEVLKRIHKKWNQNVCEEVELVSLVLLNLHKNMEKEKKVYQDLEAEHANIVAPATDGILRPTNKLVIEDPAYQTSANLYILHGQISPDTGKALGVKSKQRGIVECFTSGFFTPFGQSESLVTRLTGILEDYPCDSSIMKELIQNADDAGATEIHFIKNYESHSSTKIFGKQNLQGPSLCIFNDSYFTEEDFNGIRNIGIGSKRDDPSKTGQYGIGFNAVYHLTDVPSFLTKGPGLGNRGQMCIFDPLMTDLEGYVTKENPGIKCEVEQMEESFPDMLLGYPDISLLSRSGRGTMFRLPFRQISSDISRNVLSVAKMNDLLHQCKEDLSECLLFLRNVKCIKISSYSDEKLTEEFKVEAQLTEDDSLSRTNFFSSVKERVRANRECRHNMFCLQPIESSYSVKIIGTSGKNENWLIINRFGIDHIDEKYCDIMTAVKEKTIGLLPLASVALLIPKTNIKPVNAHVKSRKFLKGKAFCFLPLPVQTGLPFHVNGHFALDKARSKLWNEGDRNLWNMFVLAEIISVASLKAMILLKGVLLPENSLNRKVCEHILGIYHHYFPVWDKASDNFWKFLVSSFYRKVIEGKATLFPSCSTSLAQDKCQTSENTDIRWVYLSCSESDLDGTFNDIMGRTDMILFTRKESILVENSFKRMGMKIIETPKGVYTSMERSAIDYLPKCCPKYGMKFLKTYKDFSSNSKCCNLGGIDIPVSDTTVLDVDTLISIIRFVRLDEKFNEQLCGLPLCLTNDRILRTFKTDSPVYCSEMCHVLTGSASRFIHSQCIHLINNSECYDTGVAKLFEVNDFISIIAETFDRSTFANGNHIIWNKENGIPIKQEVVYQIFQFIFNKSLQDGLKHLNQQQFEINVKQFRDWAFLPSCSSFGSETINQLVPIGQTCSLLYKLPRNNDIDNILSKLNIPCLDKMLFVNNDTCLLPPLLKMLPSTERPLELLECLLHYKMKVQSAFLLPQESITLLSFFNNNLNVLKQEITDENNLDMKLRCLPLFVTHFGQTISIENSTDVIVLPPGIPEDGLNMWAERTGICVLRMTDLLEKLYEFLKLSKMDNIDVYIAKILPKIHNLPRETWKVHIEFIRDKLLKLYFLQELNDKQRVLVRQLTGLPFITVSGKNKRVHDLYDYRNRVFASMLSQDNFLPDEYRHYRWSAFMELLGLIMKPTDEMIVEFALELDKQRCSPISDIIQEQSEALIECLFADNWQPSTLKQLKKIRFVLPFAVNEERRKIFQQPGNGKELICFSGSTSSKNEDLCWSNTDLLGEVPHPSKLKQALGIIEVPSIDTIVKHCQNICDVMKRQLEQKRISDHFVKYLMIKLYNELDKRFQQSMQKSFQVTPIVFHPEDQVMLPLKAVVVCLSIDEEVRPYLYKLPGCFGAYEDLFIKLGSDGTVNSSHYARILEIIKEHYGDEPLPANVLVNVKKALENIVRLIEKESELFSNVRKLYFPNHGKCLVDVTTLTVSNNDDIKERLHDKLKLNFFIGFKEMEVSISDPEGPFLKFPQHLKPDILTDVVVEEISLEEIKPEDSTVAQKVENFFRDPNFVEGVLRLVKQQLKNRKPFTKELANDFMLRLTNVEVTKVSGLKTFLKYKGNTIDDTERDAACFIKTQLKDYTEKEKVIEYKLFFQVNDESDDIVQHLIEDPDGLVKVIDLCTDGILEKMSQHLTVILRLLDNPAQIKAKLDKMRIAAYDLPASFPISVFPRPGTYVEERFHPFLEQSIVPFKAHEFRFVALEVENDDESGDLVYIYAHIVRENKRRPGEGILQISYTVDVGKNDNEFINVPLHSLYKFTPRQREEEQALIVYDIEPIGCIPIDENFRRVRQILSEAWLTTTETERKRIIRRLLHRWHPDRNSTQRDYAERVFNYINQIVLKLENNETIDDTVNDDTGRTKPDMSGSSFGAESCSAYSRGQRYAAAFRDNMQEYNRSTRTGNYSHSRAENAIVRHIGEAKRWYRQAVFDFKAAETNVISGDRDKSFNWVCYKCHQASEKALKAAWFAKNANRARQKGHSLTAIAIGLDEGSLFNEAQNLEGVTGNYSYMRYPDAVAGCTRIPAELFGSDTATKAIDITKRILDMTSEIID